jgi:membrane protease YdiL (CAAX protease family)
MNKSVFIALGIFTLLGFPLIGFGITEIFSDRHWYYFIEHGTKWYYQIPIGIAIGVLSGYFAIKIIDLKFMRDIKFYYSNLLRDLKLNTFQIYFISFCAGFGEEILFRGSLQAFFGIWITSIVFVAIHGYLNPKDWKISLYGLYMTLCIVVISFAYEWYGIITAIVAHTVIDIMLFRQMKRINSYASNLNNTFKAQLKL